MMDLFIPYILSHIIDNVVPAASPELIFRWGGVMILCAVVSIASNINGNRIASKVARDTTERVRHDLFVKISSLSCRQMDKFTVPSLISRLTSDAYNIHHMLATIQRIGVRAPILLLGGIIVTLTLEPVLALVLISVMPIACFIVFTISRKGTKLYTLTQQAVDKLVRSVQENTVGIRVIKALSKTEWEKKRFDEVNNEVTKREKKAGKTLAATSPIMNLLINLGLTAVIIVGAYRVNAGISLPGKIIAFLTYFTIILNAMISLTRIFTVYSKASASGDRIAQVLEAKDDRPLALPDHVDSDYHLVFDDVSFSYNKRFNNISNISFSLKRGETLGIIGATGSGKSTIVQLMLGFYAVDQGAIRINGDNINSMPEDILHKKFGVTLQNDFLMSDTIRENIALGRDIPDEQIRFASEMAQALDFIEERENGFENRLSVKANNLSGGQKQRILIARALAGDPEILILDDASSALDYKTDANLRREIHNNFADTTTVIVAQRISSIMNADHILVLESGRAIGYGTHSELMQNCEIYREICENQMGGDENAAQR